MILPNENHRLALDHPYHSHHVLLIALKGAKGSRYTGNPSPALSSKFRLNKDSQNLASELREMFMFNQNHLLTYSNLKPQLPARSPFPTPSTRLPTNFTIEPPKKIHARPTTSFSQQVFQLMVTHKSPILAIPNEH